MNIARFLEHWSITENPFRAEEARHDPVFARLGPGPTTHPDFDKILGDPARPSTAIVFGEKGSGKTAIRLQLAARLTEHNAKHPDAKVLLVPYDDLNATLDRFHAVCKSSGGDRSKEVMAILQQFRLVDHMDAILHAAVPRVVDLILGVSGEGGTPADAERARRAIRSAAPGVRRDLQLLQAIYDRADAGPARAASLRRRIRAPRNRSRLLWRGLALGGWLLPLAVALGSFTSWSDAPAPLVWLYVFFGALAVWGVLLAKWFVLDRWVLRRLSRRLARRMRSVPHSTEALAAALERLPSEDRHHAVLPVDDAEEKRYAMFARLRRALAPLGYAGVIIVLDRIDEPALISGDPGRMRAVVWPLMNNKFLQQDGIGVKLLLPVELRHELFRESTVFFQEARLDKQNLIERLSWTGSTLLDLCNARLRACRLPDAAPIALADLFEQDVTRQDLIDALDQMHQPRDAFKLLYQCMQEHCSNMTEEQDRWRVPRYVLDTVRKQQSERVQMFSRGIRPA